MLFAKQVFCCVAIHGHMITKVGVAIVHEVVSNLYGREITYNILYTNIWAAIFESRVPSPKPSVASSTPKSKSH